jgi:hypothetical protein
MVLRNGASPNSAALHLRRTECLQFLSACTMKTPWPESASELYRPSDRRSSAKLVETFANRMCHVVSVTDPYGRILGFLDQSSYFFFQVAPQLYSRGWVDPFPDPLLLKTSGSARNRTRASGSVDRNCDNYTPETVIHIYTCIYIHICIYIYMYIYIYSI